MVMQISLLRIDNKHFVLGPCEWLVRWVVLVVQVPDCVEDVKELTVARDGSRKMRVVLDEFKLGDLVNCLVTVHD